MAVTPCYFMPTICIDGNDLGYSTGLSEIFDPARVQLADAFFAEQPACQRVLIVVRRQEEVEALAGAKAAEVKVIGNGSKADWIGSMFQCKWQKEAALLAGCRLCVLPCCCCCCRRRCNGRRAASVL